MVDVQADVGSQLRSHRNAVLSSHRQLRRFVTSHAWSICTIASVGIRSIIQSGQAFDHDTPEQPSRAPSAVVLTQ